MKTLHPFDFSQTLSGWKGGQGPVMVLIHGVGLRSESWNQIVPHLEKHFSLVLLDLPGHGSSPRFDQQPNLNDYTNRISEVLAKLDEPAIVVGHSMGALIAMDIAFKHTNLVAGIAPLNTIFRRSEEAKKAVINRAAEIQTKGISDPAPTLERWFGAEPKNEMKIAAQDCHEWLTTVDPAGYAHAYSVFATEDGLQNDQLEKIKSPALFITGADEPNSTPEMSYALAERVQNGRAIIVKNARHMMPMTHGEIVSNHLIEAFANKEHANV